MQSEKRKADETAQLFCKERAGVETYPRSHIFSDGQGQERC